MSCFKMPKKLIKDIHRLISRFWWGSNAGHKKIHWAKWDNLCQPKDKGGKMLKACYFPNCSFLETKLGGKPSYTWRSIWWGREIFDLGSRWRMGSGDSIRVVEDRWLPVKTRNS
ncbi:hypothetical protein UlMin_020762 [Ulmus minor]